MKQFTNMKAVKRFVASAALVAAIFSPALMVSAAGPLDGLTIPPADPSLTYVAPSPNQPNYDARLQVFLQATVPDTYQGQQVDFLTTLNDTGVDVLGLPTSAPTPDPNNPNFIYQRFQNGVLFYNGTEGMTSILPLN
jgi:hypothetical protein